MNTGDIGEITIETLVHGGDGLGRINGQIVFVPWTVPEDRVRVRITSCYQDYARGEIVEILKPSPSRIAPTCEMFGACGGCQWQHINYDRQLSAKAEIVHQALLREGKITQFNLRPTIPSPQEFHYRHRMQFSVNHRDRTPHIGLYKGNSHDLIEMKTCLLAHPLINSFLFHLRQVFNHHDNRLIQGVDLTVDGKGERLLLVFHFKLEDEEGQKQLYEQIKATLPEVSGAVLRTEAYKKAKTMLIGEQQALYPTVGFNLYIGPETFIQVNSAGNKVLVQTVLELISEVLEVYQVTEGKRIKILELHCGVGNFTLPMSRLAREVVGVESSPDCTELARKGIWVQGITNGQVLNKSDLKGVKYLLRNNRSFDLLLVDPPRCGCKEILEYIPQLGIKHIIYVSCSPPTLARDLRVLSGLGYQVDIVQPIDMFPHTHHVESVVRLSRQ